MLARLNWKALSAKRSRGGPRIARDAMALVYARDKAFGAYIPDRLFTKTSAEDHYCRWSSRQTDIHPVHRPNGARGRIKHDGIEETPPRSARAQLLTATGPANDVM